MWLKSNAVFTLRMLIASALLLASAGTAAVQSLVLRMGEIQGPGGISASDLQLKINIAGPQPTGTLSIEQLVVPGLDSPLRKLSLSCAQMTLSNLHIGCSNGRLEAGMPDALAQLVQNQMPVSFDYYPQEKRLDLRLPRWVSSYNSDDGALASDGLRAALEISLVQREKGWDVQGNLGLDAGQAYVEPVFLDFGEMPARVEFSGWVDAANQRVELREFSLQQPQVLTATGNLVWADNALQSMDLSVSQAHLPRAFNTYAQPFLIGTALDALTPEGELRAHIKRDANGWSALSASGQGLQVKDENNRLSLTGGNLELDWQRERALTQAPLSWVSWESATLYKIELGHARFDWRMGGDDIALERPANVPVFEGQLSINNASAQGVTGANPSVDFNATLTPIRLAKLTRALGWPAFKGELSGSLPGLQYRDGELTINGGLSLQVFDGEVEIRKLSLTNPLSAQPRMRADALARNLDLQAMSSAFSFGRISGRLDADITGLRMLAWQPVEFKAWLRTPEGDRSRHRISQRAIDDIASLGGGGAGLVSRGFLGLFEDFAYDRIGLGCAMKQGICLMRGLESAANGGYVIVRGRWLPRIDVVGYNKVVNWAALLEQLKSISQSSGPVVNPDKSTDS